jgi:hypothetical protein
MPSSLRVVLAACALATARGAAVELSADNFAASIAGKNAFVSAPLGATRVLTPGTCSRGATRPGAAMAIAARGAIPRF